MKTRSLSAVRVVARRFSPLAVELMARGLTFSEVARRARLDRRRVSDVANALRSPGGRETAAIARAARLPLRELARLLSRTELWARRRAA